MTLVAAVAWNVQGDIGGQGISRFWFRVAATGGPTNADCNAVAAASRSLLASTQPYMPSAISWSCQAQVDVYDADSGLVQVSRVITSLPANVSGVQAGNYVAGTGARVAWKTALTKGRRLIQGALFIAPMSQQGFAANGALAPAAVSAINSAANGYIVALTPNGQFPVVWSRPPKGLHAGGVAADVNTAVCGTVPASLRSRRV